MSSADKKIMRALVLFMVAVPFLTTLFTTRTPLGREDNLASAEDTVPPQISKIKISEVGATTTRITWATDEKADSLVNYSLNKAIGISRSPDISTEEHDIFLSELEPSTKYYFRVISTDSAGNQSVSGHYSFVTKGGERVENIEKVATEEEKALVEKAVAVIKKVQTAEALEAISGQVEKKGEEVATPPRIIGEPLLDIGFDEVTINWETDKDSNSLVSLASDDTYSAERAEPYSRTEGDVDAYKTKHEVRLQGLRPGTLYHYQISSKSRLGLAAKSPDRTFSTKAIMPEIFSIRLNKVEEESATISWSTQVPASGLVEYTDMTTRETKSLGNPAFLVGHSIQLKGLKFRTRYQVVVKARNQTGEEAVSVPLTFITAKDEAPPVISQVSNESTLYPGADSKVQTIMSWDTDEVSSCQVFYGQGLAVNEEDASSFQPENGFITKHVQVATEFAPSTVYKFWVICKDRNANQARSEDFVLYTPEKEKNIIDIILENFESTFGWVKNIGK